MEVRIRLSATDPPRGEIVFPTPPSLTFSGWLELLGALQHALEASGAGTDPVLSEDSPPLQA